MKYTFYAEIYRDSIIGTFLMFWQYKDRYLLINIFLDQTVMIVIILLVFSLQIIIFKNIKMCFILFIHRYSRAIFLWLLLSDSSLMKHNVIMTTLEITNSLNIGLFFNVRYITFIKISVYKCVVNLKQFP